ncbi:hypothetical protein M409DRAFT_36183 [Zasmidium cellare ATCC 36951]|uniref:Terpene cyclase/mutase family member n=1 Tax=Zasmidium cellare ATCC 36951 TaxID=1080233 RepID=A0A6A6CPZ7_ZASCE|nr:uncharacterized protein M409DRAFT_36183 [Zasmidium cellare ATCC 36951]KAF2169175.1 hypothetical protein M409DRAFT_36183 [Zasmidium cellare ATCC 36951]
MTSIQTVENAEDSEPLEDRLAKQCRESILAARRYAFAYMISGDHWNGEVRSNVTITAEYVFLYHYLGIDERLDRNALISFLESQQLPDGSWSIAPEHPGDLSVSCEAYLALKLLGVSPKAQKMESARAFIQSKGGLSSVRVFTRIYLAMFGLMSWDYVPQLLPELILVHDSAPISIYRFSSWARVTLVPLIVICYHRPVFALPNGRSSSNDYLDELWLHPSRKVVKYAIPYRNLVQNRNFVGMCAKFADTVLFYLSKIRLPGSYMLRQYAVRKCVEWILAHQEPSGDWAGIFPPLHASIVAIHLEGIPFDDLRFQRALQAIERFTITDRLGKRAQPCVSAGWDTALMVTALLDTCREPDDATSEVRQCIDSAIQWMNNRQSIGCPGDWRIYRPLINSGGHAFGYFNSWYPDLDDTQAVVVACMKADSTSITSDHVVAALEWLLGMQSSDGGWSAFDYDNDKLYLNQIPFSDMDALCDPATADVTGGVLEAFGLVLQAYETSMETMTRTAMTAKIEKACESAINFVLKHQESNGSWWGRWGCNYTYGTSKALVGLKYFITRKGYGALFEVVQHGVDFLCRCQNPDGGWGESTLSYVEPISTAPGHVEYVAADSTPSQTAWALIALLAYRPTSDEHITKGISFLVRTQTEEGHGRQVNGCNLGDRTGRSWPEPSYTAPVVPGHMMLGYEFYSHYWPMMALGRFVTKKAQEG